MTTKEYLINIKTKYPNTYIGLNAFYKNNNPSVKEFILTFSNTPLDYTISIIIHYIEYRQVNFLESLCNTQIDNVADNHEILRMKTVTYILHRLEKNIIPFEGQPF